MYQEPGEYAPAQNFIREVKRGRSKRAIAEYFEIPESAVRSILKRAEQNYEIPFDNDQWKVERARVEAAEKDLEPFENGEETFTPLSSYHSTTETHPSYSGSTPKSYCTAISVMSNDGSKDDAIEDLHEHQSTINLINCALMAIKDIGGRNTREIEHRLHEMLGRETREIHDAINRIENAEDDPEAS